MVLAIDLLLDFCVMSDPTLGGAFQSMFFFSYLWCKNICEFCPQGRKFGQIYNTKAHFPKISQIFFVLKRKNLLQKHKFASNYASEISRVVFVIYLIPS
jgi:hypothetical protein